MNTGMHSCVSVSCFFGASAGFPVGQGKSGFQVGVGPHAAGAGRPRDWFYEVKVCKLSVEEFHAFID